MTVHKQGYQGVFYSGDKAIDYTEIRLNEEEIQPLIEKKEEDHSMFQYYPWDRVEIEKINFRVRPSN